MKAAHFLLALLTACISIFHGSEAEARQNRWTHFGVRPLAMGNAYVSVADDFNALFYNPAGLARISEWDGEILNPTLSIGADSVELISDIIDLSGASTAEILDLFQDKTGKNLHFGVGLTPHLIFQNFGFGIGFNTGADITAHSDLDIDTKIGAEVIVPVTYARNFLSDRLSAGITLKGRFFAGIDETLNIETIGQLSDKDNKSDKNNDLAKAGGGVGIDTGLLFTPIKTMSPTLGISVTDLGGTTYEGNNAPKDVLPSVNTGFSIMPLQTDFTFLRLSVEAHSINQPIHYSHKLHLGAEWGLSSIFKLQAGLSDGYPTGGFEFDVGLLNMRFATYALDHGTVVGINDDLIDRRYVLQIKLLI